VEVSCGPLSSIKLANTSVSLSCGESKIELTPTGVVITGPNVDIAGDLTLKLQGLQVESNARAILQASAVVEKRN
jgi:hypothetical protein